MKNQPYFKPRPIIRKKPPDPMEQLRRCDTVELAAGINHILKALEEKGVTVCDYDHPERKLYRVKIIRGRLFFLAAEEE